MGDKDQCVLVFIPCMLAWAVMCLFSMINWDGMLNRMVKCQTCKLRLKHNDPNMHQILHGIDSMSDSWVEYICDKCSKTRKVKFFSEHVLR